MNLSQIFGKIMVAELRSGKGTPDAAAGAVSAPPAAPPRNSGVLVILESAKSILKTIFVTDLRTSLHR
jgi:hypothetical protein